MYYESNSLEEFKWLLVKATLENYIFYKYNLNLDDIPQEDVDSFISYMINTYNPLLVSYYNNMKKPIRESIEDSKKYELANNFLKLRNLKRWKNDNYKMYYLATKKGTIIFLLEHYEYEGGSGVYSISVQKEIYDVLFNIFNDENKLNGFIIKFLKEQGFKKEAERYDIESSDNVGVIEGDDEPMGPEDLNENKMLPKNKFAKSWLSKFDDLKKYKSEDGYYIYLANSNGTIMVQLNTQINETAVSFAIWNILENHFTEKETRRKIIGWLLDKYRLADMGYVYKASPSVLGKISLGDTPMDKDSIRENENKDPLKTYFKKIWDKEKSMGKIPRIGNLSRLGLTHKKNEIVQYYSEYMGLETNYKTEAIRNFLTQNKFTEKDITSMSHDISEGKITVVFNSVKFEEDGNKYWLSISFSVLDGSFYNEDEGIVMRFSDEENFFDDFVTYWEFKSEIENIVSQFVFEVIESFGFNIDKNFHSIDISWS